MVCPVIQSASSLTSQATGRAVSAGLLHRWPDVVGRQRMLRR
jgi:hypothetical protein